MRSILQVQNQWRKAGTNTLTAQAADVQRLLDYIKAQLENRPVRDELERLLGSKSTAGSRREEVFTAEFLCPVLRKFFSEEAHGSVRSLLRWLDANGHSDEHNDRRHL